MNTLSRFLFLALAALLVTTTAACGDDDSTDTSELDAEFASASDEQIEMAIEYAALGGASNAVFLFALAIPDAEDSCPRLEVDGDTTTLIGDGCVLDGTTFSGRATAVNPLTFDDLFGDTEPSGPASYDFQDFALSDDALVLGVDGTVEISDLSGEDGDVVSELTVTAGTDVVAIDHRFACANERCTQTGTVDISSLGAYRVDGSVNDLAGNLRLEGADVLTIELVEDTCVPFQVDGENAGTYCPDSAQEDLPDLLLPMGATLSNVSQLLRL